MFSPLSGVITTLRTTQNISPDSPKSLITQPGQELPFVEAAVASPRRTVFPNEQWKTTQRGEKITARTPHLKQWWETVKFTDYFYKF